MTRQDSSDTCTSNLVSSLARDQSPHESSPSLSLKSDPPIVRSDSPSKPLQPQPTLSSESEELNSKKVKRKSPRVRVEKRSASLHPMQPVKEALSPSVAESIRAVFAAFVWHEGIVHDAMAVASYLKVHPNLSKFGHDLNAAAGKMDEASASSPSRQRQRHSAEVSLSAYMNANLECAAAKNPSSTSMHGSGKSQCLIYLISIACSGKLSNLS